ncbi:MAG: D-alanyl-D-alanine carboxypeptidase [Bacteroidales bacterium]
MKAGKITIIYSNILIALLRLPFIILGVFTVITGSCTSTRYLGRTAIPDRFLDDPAITDTHVGIAIYDTDRNEYIYTRNSDKFFVPASNTKIATLYAGLKYLGDSIPGIRFAEHNDTIFLQATGDPTFLLLDFPRQPVFNFLQRAEKPLVFFEPLWETGALGYGWSWDDYLGYYMPERSPFPVYGNIIIWAQRDMAGLNEDVKITYVSSYPRHPWPVEIMAGTNDKFEVRRPVTLNEYSVFPGMEGDRELFVPYVTDGMSAALELLSDTLNRDIVLMHERPDLLNQPDIDCLPDMPDLSEFPFRHDPSYQFNIIYSRAADSLFMPMMLYSDNFFAEQTMLMVSNKLFGVMDEALLIEYLLENDLREIPDKPRWVDGSGLSRYNLFSPQSFVWLLEKMTDEFGFERISHLLPSGNEGTLENFYQDEKGKIFAKTGTLSGNAIALSGFLITGKGRTLIFSVLVNNHNKDSNDVRRATETFLRDIIYRY